MRTLYQSENSLKKSSIFLCVRSQKSQHGVVLIISLIMLVVISLLAVTSMRNAGSTESVLGNVRTTELATQAAEIALRHCESSVAEIMSVAKGSAPSYPTTFVAANIFTAITDESQWNDIAIWDSLSASTFKLPLALVNEAGMDIVTYKRPPECMVEPLTVLFTNLPLIQINEDKSEIQIGSNRTASSSNSTYIITARGFGPEVVAGSGRPQGTEVWLQSHIELDNNITRVECIAPCV